MLSEQFPHQLESCRLVPLRLDQEVQDFAFSIDSAPEIHLLAADRDEHLVEVPTIIRSWPEAPKPPRIAVSEFEYPTTHGLVRDFEATLSQQILNIAEAQRKAAIEPHGVLNNIGRKTVAAV